ncbi:BTAD domain-containing putative transcriptional regulator [Amycolatopsis sp. NPDC049688]|uniref:AfsR/SARP family transcriptional regulator n=1 Tax=Amycolatopsis sp. NPDC049688 TaxID=3154733 RepID=UPI00341A7ED1
MQFRVLGPLEVKDGPAVLKLGGPRQRAVMAALLLRPNAVASIGYLAGAAWESPPVAPESNIRTYIAGLRRRLSAGGAGSRLVTRGGGYELVVTRDELDLLDFEDLANRGVQSLRQGDLKIAVRYFERATGLWRSRPLEDQSVSSQLQAEVTRLEERRLHLITLCLKAKIDLGWHDEVIAELSRLIAEYPLREELWAQRMLALHRAGRQAEALDAFGQARERLAAELGVEPGQALQRLRQRILAGDGKLAPPAPRHPGPYCCLPRDIGDFTGRDAETGFLLATLGADLRTRQAPAISVVDGMAGVGKTALAIHAAHLLAPRYPDGCLYVDLHGHAAEHAPEDSAAVLQDLLHARGVPADAIPDGLEPRAALWRSELTGRRVLVVLDNAVSAAQLRPILPATGGNAVLVTSRGRLTDLDPAHSLSLEVLPSGEAEALFSRVLGDSRVLGQVESVGAVVRLCGYLPLAIRIAVARLRSRPLWTVDYLLERLRRTGELHALSVGDRSVAAAFTLSYRHLPADQQRCFRMLGLIPGPDFDTNAVAALCDTSWAEADRLVEQLLDVHLLEQPAAGRYRFHDLVRSYARQLAADHDGPDSRPALGRLFDYYLAGVSTAVRVVAPQDAPHGENAPPTRVSLDLSGREQAMAWLDVERANLVAAATYASGHGWPAHTSRLSMFLGHYCHLRGHREDALALHTHALSATRRTGDRAREGHALNSLGVVYWWLGRCDKAVPHLQRALDVARDTGDRGLEGTTLTTLGGVYWWLGRYDKAVTLMRLALDLARAVGDPGLEGRAAGNLGIIDGRAGRYEEATSHLRQALALAQETGDRTLEGHTRRAFAVVFTQTGQYEEGLAQLRQALALAEETGDRPLESQCRQALGVIFALTGHHEAGLAHLEHALALARQAGYRHLEAEALNRLGEADHLGRDPGAAAEHHRQALVIAVEIGNRYEQARAHAGLADVYQGAHRILEAIEHWGSAQELYARLEVPDGGALRRRVDAAYARCGHRRAAGAESLRPGRHR